MRTICTLIALVLCCALAQAKTLKPLQFEDGERVQVQDGYAYLLVRFQGDLPGALFVRSLSADEVNAGTDEFQKHGSYPKEPNWVAVAARDTYADAKGEKTYVMAVQPGTYVVAAYGFQTSLCLGTVKFEAKAGVLTDLGTYLVVRDDKPTGFPELAAVVRGKRFMEDYVWWDIAVRPPTQSMPVPLNLASLPRALADYRAMGKFPNYFHTRISRLTPIPGVLDYDKEGNVIDVKAASTP